jgi:hypothetical protein
LDGRGARRLPGVVHIYKTGDVEVVGLQGLDLTVGVGEMVAIASHDEALTEIANRVLQIRDGMLAG